MEVVCTNKAWDDANPAGTSLNDLIKMDFESYYDFVKDGYSHAEALQVSQFRKPLTELTETDLYMLSTGPDLYFETYPQGPRTLELRFTTVDGVVKTVTCEI